MTIVKLAHISDVHLRVDQYGQLWRGDDFSQAWLQAVDSAIEERVHLCTFGGDMFEKSNTRPVPFSAATEGLKRLKNAGVPIVGIKGNHDIEYPGQQDTWLDLLSDEGLIILIDDENDGIYYHGFGEVLVRGLPYSGHATVADMAKFSTSRIKPSPYTITLMHAGLEGILPGHQTGTFKLEEARQLIKPQTDLLLLGHIHKPYIIDNWIYNPGSLEACDSQQARWSSRGMYIFTIDTEKKSHTTKILHPDNRRWIFVGVDMTGKGREEVSGEIDDILAFEEDKITESILHLTLFGQADFPASSIEVSPHYQPKFTILINKTHQQVEFIKREIDSDAIEDKVLTDLHPNPSKVKKIMEMALVGIDPGVIMEELC